MTTRITDRSATRNGAIKLLDQFRQELIKRGFARYREGELLHTDTGRHVRIGYASDEWTIHLGDLRGHTVFVQDTYRMDLRIIGPDRALPALSLLIQWAEA